MKELLNKISSYDIVNTVLPGILVGLALEHYFDVPISNYNLVLAFAFYYLLGVFTSRVGSLVIEPIAEKISSAGKRDYPAFVRAEKADEKLSLLMETANTYRSLSAAGIVCLLIFIASEFFSGYGRLLELAAILITTCVMLLAYKKQLAYVVKRVDIYQEDEGVDN